MTHSANHSPVVRRLLRRLCLLVREELWSSRAAVSIVRDPLIKTIFESTLKAKKTRLGELLQWRDGPQFLRPNSIDRRGYGRHYPLYESLPKYSEHRTRRLLFKDLLDGQVLVLRYYLHLGRSQPRVCAEMACLCRQHAESVKREMASTRQVWSAFGGAPSRENGASSHRSITPEVGLQMGDRSTLQRSLSDFVVDEAELYGAGD